MAFVLTRLLLCAIFVLALYSIWGLYSSNGGSDQVDVVLAGSPPRLPGTVYPVKTKYVGVELIDHQLAMLAVVFWQIVDGSMPHFSLFSFMFAGQAVAALILLMVEGARVGNRGRLVS